MVLEGNRHWPEHAEPPPNHHAKPLIPGTNCQIFFCTRTDLASPAGFPGRVLRIHMTTNLRPWRSTRSAGTSWWRTASPPSKARGFWISGDRRIRCCWHQPWFTARAQCKSSRWPPVSLFFVLVCVFPPSEAFELNQARKECSYALEINLEAQTQGWLFQSGGALFHCSLGSNSEGSPFSTAHLHWALNSPLLPKEESSKRGPTRSMLQPRTLNSNYPKRKKFQNRP